jgi:hypothetical protein
MFRQYEMEHVCVILESRITTEAPKEAWDLQALYYTILIDHIIQYWSRKLVQHSKRV